ncbi:MAG: hypothetical protein GY847_34195 [Proteobacteria bacterium]|nr:hypothetical protein [Pseudomonadota bacterium]
MRTFCMILGGFILLTEVVLAQDPASVLAQDSASGLLRAGPAEDPHVWPDYGGTPDIAVSEDMGLSQDEIKSLLEHLKSPDQADRAKAADDLQRNATGSDNAIRSMLWDRHGARNSEMRQSIRVARKREQSLGKKGDLLNELIAIDPVHPELGKGAYGAVRILTMLRSLNSLDTLAAYKVMIEFSPRHAGVFRHEIGRMLVAHGLNALPALVYSRGSKNREIHMFSVKWIRDLGNPLLSEQVKLKNPRRLAQLLESYASVNDLDAIDVTLSFTNHDSIFVRTAARHCLKSYGNNAKWSVRRLYENTLAKKPADETEVPHLLKELYLHFDTQRLLPMTELFESGFADYEKGRFKEMERAYKKVLKTEPMFPGRRKMAKGFLEFGDTLENSGQRDEARLKLRTAHRLAEPGTETARRAEARLKWIQAEELRAVGVVDPGMYKQVLKSDPEHSGASKWDRRLAGDRASPEQLVTKAIVVSFFVFLAALLVFLRLRS